ncbi:MAG: 50S ribosomal protein L31 [Planctomycetota bacterium]
MQKDIHPAYKKLEAKCTCGATFQVMSTMTDVNVAVCSQCHPFFTGAKRLMDASGRVDKFQRRFAGWDAQKAAAQDKK